jgi:uncharacterized membrane protein
MWFLLHLIPDGFLHFIVHGITALGLIGFLISIFAKKIPLVSNYGVTLGLVSILVLVLGVYLEGGYSVEMMWRDRAADLEKQIALADEKSKTINAVIETQIVKEVQTVHDIKIKLQDRLITIKEKIDSECIVDSDAIDLLNKAAMNPLNYAEEAK